MKEPLLPSNFLLYARCVSNLLKCVDEHQKKYNREHGQQAHITISTIFKGGIDRWFNVSYISKAQIWFTPPWWFGNEDAYLDLVRKFSKERNIYMRRIVGFPIKSNPRDVIIKCRDKDPYFLTNHDFREFVKDGKLDGVTLLDSINLKDPSQVHDCNIIPLGILEDNIPDGWQKAVDFFQNYFHTNWNYESQRKGVFYKYCRKKDLEKNNNHLSKDDLFIVEINYGNGEKGKAFGIIFNQSEEKDTSGIKPLDSQDLTDALNEFEKCWNSFAKKDINDIYENQSPITISP